jgi:hypothetical protein
MGWSGLFMQGVDRVRLNSTAAMAPARHLWRCGPAPSRNIRGTISNTRSDVVRAVQNGRKPARNISAGVSAQPEETSMALPAYDCIKAAYVFNCSTPAA